MAENDVTIQINLDARDAQAAIELFGKESVAILKKTETQADSFFNSFSKAKGTVVAAIGTIIGAYYTMSNAIEQASEDAKLTRQIEASLRATDEASTTAVNGVLQFAEALKEATGVSDDLVKQTFITAKSFGITADEAKKLTTAAIDLASATGIDAETAVRQLGGTLDGTIGKIGNLGAEFRNLTTEQLKSGKAIDLVNSKFGGTAAKELDTYQGAANSLKNAWDDLLKSFGKTVTESDSAKNALAGLAAVLNDFTKAISNSGTNSEQIDAAIARTAALGGNIGKAADSILKAQEKFNMLGVDVGKQSKDIATGFAAIVKSATGSTKAVLDFEDQLASLPEKAVGPVQKTGKELEELQKKAKKLAEEAQRFKEGIFGEFGTQVEREAAKAQQALQKVSDFQKQGAFSAKEAYDLRLRIALDFNQKQVEAAKKAADEEKKQYDDLVNAAKSANDQIRQDFDKQKQFLQSVFENPFGDLAARLQDQIARAIQYVKTGQDIGTPFKEGEIAASISGGINLALQGKQGAVKAVSAIGEAIGQSFGIPGMGAITELLARGPEETKKFIKEFINSIPDIVQAIAESIPVVVETFVDVMVNKGGAVRIGIAIAKAMAGQAIWARLGQEIFGKSGNEIGDAIKSGSAEFASNTKDSFTQFITEFGPTIIRTGKLFGRDIQDSIKQAQASWGPIIKRGFDEFITTIADFISSFGPALEKFIVDFPTAIYNGLVGLFKALGEAVIGPLQAVFSPLQEAFYSLQNAVSPLTQAINNLVDPIERLISAMSGGKGGGKGVVAEFFNGLGDAIDRAGGKPITQGAATVESTVRQEVNKVLGLRRGGVVYAADGFTPRGTDTVPAMLTPGEMVIPRDMVGELAGYLARQSPDNASSTDAMLASIMTSLQSPIVVKTEAKVNQQAFADIILQLNRQNARLRA